MQSNPRVFALQALGDKPILPEMASQEAALAVAGDGIGAAAAHRSIGSSTRLERHVD